MAKLKLTLILPELATILNQPMNRGVLPPYLTKIIKQALFTANDTRLQRLLLNHFSQTVLNEADLPMAHCLVDKKNVIFATPCHLHPDRDRLLLFHDDLDISEQEGAALIEEIQPLLTEFGGQFIQLQEGKWLMQLDQMPDLTLTALEDVAIKGVDASLPQGKDRQNYLRLWNEIQMQLHECDINQQRVAQGKLPINSVWFWGAGILTVKENTWKGVQGKSVLLEKLAQQTKTEYHPSIHSLDEALSTGKHLLLLDNIELEADWPQQLQDIDDTVLKPLWQQCKQAKIAAIDLQIPDHGSYHLSTFDCWKFWK